MAGAVFIARCVLFLALSGGHALASSSTKAVNQRGISVEIEVKSKANARVVRTVQPRSGGSQSISLDVDANSKVLANAPVLRKVQMGHSGDSNAAIVDVVVTSDAVAAPLKAEGALNKRGDMAVPLAQSNAILVNKAVFDALAASQVAAARATAAADVAVRAQRAASTLVTISVVTALFVIVLHMPRLLGALWGRETKSNILSFDLETQLGKEDLNKKVIDCEAIQGENHDVPKIHYHAALAALKLNDRAEGKPATPADIASLARSSQIPAAYRQLQKLSAAGVDVQVLSGLTTEEFERLRRIGAVYEASLPQLHKQVSTYKTSEKNAALQLEWGINLDCGMMKVMSIQDMPGVDIMTCVAAHVEKEVTPLYDKDTISSECCGERLDNDGIWRTIIHTRSTGSKSDLINYSSLVDALDEPCGSIWVAYYVSPEFTPACAGIPPPMAGHFRTPKSLYVIRFEPLNAKTRMGVRMTSFLEAGVSTAVYSLLTLMPSFALRRLVRGMVETAAESLDNFCRANAKIDELMKTSPSADLYQRLQSRLEEKK